MAAADDTVAGDAPPRLDVWLAQQRSITRHAAHTMIDGGLVTVNGRLGRAGQRVRDRDVVTVSDADRVLPALGIPPIPRDRITPARSALTRGDRAGTPTPALGMVPSLERHPIDLVPSPAGHPIDVAPELNVVYEDDALAVIDKPAGMVVHPAPGHRTGTLADALRARGSTWSLLGGEERAGIVHRLDRDTSGLLVVAKTEAAHRALAAQLRDRTLGRVYWAIVRGGFREDTGTIEAPIGRDPRNRKRMAVVDGGRAAATDFRVIERLGDHTLIEVRLRTGRTHQIRTHLAYIRHPIAGDPVYGRADPRLTRPALHATRLTLTHPDDATQRTFDSPPPLELLAFLDTLREPQP